MTLLVDLTASVARRVLFEAIGIDAAGLVSVKLPPCDDDLCSEHRDAWDRALGYTVDATREPDETGEAGA